MPVGESFRSGKKMEKKTVKIFFSVPKLRSMREVSLSLQKIAFESGLILQVFFVRLSNSVSAVLTIQLKYFF